MPKVDKPIIGDVTIETPPETIDPEMEVPEMLAPAPAPETDTIYNPPMQQGVQQASMLNEFLKQATGEKPLASLNIGDYVQCATAKINLWNHQHLFGSSSKEYIQIGRTLIDRGYNNLHVNIKNANVNISDDIPCHMQIYAKSPAGNFVKRIQLERSDTLVTLPENYTYCDIIIQIDNPDMSLVTYDILIDMTVNPSFKEEK